MSESDKISVFAARDRRIALKARAVIAKAREMLETVSDDSAPQVSGAIDRLAQALEILDYATDYEALQDD